MRAALKAFVTVDWFCYLLSQCVTWRVNTCGQHVWPARGCSRCRDSVIYTRCILLSNFCCRVLKRVCNVSSQKFTWVTVTVVTVWNWRLVVCGQFSRVRRFIQDNTSQDYYLELNSWSLLSHSTCRRSTIAYTVQRQYCMFSFCFRCVVWYILCFLCINFVYN